MLIVVTCLPQVAHHSGKSIEWFNEQLAEHGLADTDKLFDTTEAGRAVHVGVMFTQNPIRARGDCTSEGYSKCMEYTD